MLDNHIKGNFILNRTLSGESQQMVGWLSNQISSFRMSKKFLDLPATNINVTL